MPLRKPRHLSHALAIVLFLLLAPYRGSAQPAERVTAMAPQLVSDLRDLENAAMHSDYAWKQLSYLCNNIGPRLSGSSQAAAAVDYTASQLRALGLDVHLEKCKVPHWVRGEETARLTAWPGRTPGTSQKIVLTALGGSVATPPDGLEAPVVVVDSFDAFNALSEAQVRGRIVLFNARFDRRVAVAGFAMDEYEHVVAYRGRAAGLAATKGAVAALVRSVGTADFRLPHTGGMRYPASGSRIPTAAVTAEDADLLDALTRQGPVTMHLTLTPQSLPTIESANVVADIKGTTHPEEIVIMSGHLDSWDLGTGAIDDGAGAVMAMQTAQLIQSLHLRPARTIRIILWMNEENGLAGGRTYAAAHQKEIPRHFAAIEADSGAGHPVGFAVSAGPSASTLLDPLREEFARIGAPVLLANPNSGGADISLLAEAGVPSFDPVMDIQNYFDYHHTAADTLDKVDPKDLNANCAITAALTYALANLPGDLRH